MKRKDSRFRCPFRVVKKWPKRSDDEVRKILEGYNAREEMTAKGYADRAGVSESLLFRWREEDEPLKRQLRLEAAAKKSGMRPKSSIPDLF